MAESYFQSGEQEGAKRLYITLLETEPDNQQFRQRLAELDGVDIGKPDEDEAIEISEEDEIVIEVEDEIVVEEVEDRAARTFGRQRRGAGPGQFRPRGTTGRGLGLRQVRSC